MQIELKEIKIYYTNLQKRAMLKTYLTKEQIQERIAVFTRNHKYLTRTQIRQRIQELTKNNQTSYSKNAVRS